MTVEALEARIAPAATVSLAVSVLNDLDADGVADPGETLHYTVTITNGATPITLTSLSELINDPNLTLVPGSFNVQPIANDDSFNAVGNTLLRVGGTAGSQPELFVAGGSVLANDSDFFSDTFSVTPIVNGTTTLGGKVNLAADGTFTYVSEAGDTGTDSFSYTITDSHGLTNTATVSITLTGKIWYVDNSGANGSGTSLSPFNSLAGAQTASAIGDTIYVATGSGSYTNTALALKNTQTLVGEGSVLNSPTLPAGTPSGVVQLKAAGTAPTITSTGTALTLGSGDTLTGFTIGNSLIDIAGTNFGTLTVSNVTLNGTGKIFDLTTGSFAAGSSFNSISGTGSATHGLKLDAVGVTAGGTVSFGQTDISGSTAQAMFITNMNTTGTYSFGATTIGTTTAGTGGIEGIRIETITAGTINFGATTVQNSTGRGIEVLGAGSPAVSFGTTTVKNGGGDAVLVQNTTGGSVGFSGLSIDMITGKGIWLDTAGSSFNTGTGGTIVTASGTDVDITNGTGAVTITEAITNTVGALINIDNHETGNVIFSGNLSSSTAGTTGIVVNNVNSGTITFSGGTKTLSTTTNNAVNLTNNTGATINFTGGGLAITTTTGAGFAATGGGTINVTGSGNSVSTTTATAVNIANTTIGGSGVTFDSVSTNGAANGILLDTTGAGNFTATSGTIVGATTRGVDINAGSGNFTYGGTITTSGGAARSVEITGRTGGTVTISGNITDTSTGLNVASNTGGTINFSGSSKALTTGANTAVTLSSNTGATINFTGGGLTISATSGNGFAATGGGTISVTGSGNTIATTTGAALNVTSTDIGGSGLTFVSISANGAANGIVLNGTGTAAGNGGLTVTGDGVNATLGGNGSGGTIQNTTGAGVRLNSTKNMSLSYVTITNPGTDGISVTNINGFTLNRSTISDSAGTGPYDAAIDFNNYSNGDPSITPTAVNGTIDITNSLIGPASGNSPHNSVTAVVGSGTSTWNVTGTTIRNTGNSGINLEVRNSSVITAFTISGSTFAGANVAGGTGSPSARGIFVNNLEDSVVGLLKIENNTFTNNNIHIDLNQQNNAGSSGSHTFVVRNNTMTGSRSHAMNIFAAAGSFGGSFTGTINNNNIGSVATPGSGSEIGNGIRVNMNGGVTATMLITANNIVETPNGRGIEVIGRNGLGTLDVTITNNMVNHYDLTYPIGGGAAAFPLGAIYVNAAKGGGTGIVGFRVRADVRGNTVPAAGGALPVASEVTGTYLALVESAGTETGGILELVDSPPASASATAQLQSTNTGDSGANAGVALIAGPINVPPVVPLFFAPSPTDVVVPPAAGIDQPVAPPVPDTTDVSVPAVIVPSPVVPSPVVFDVPGVDQPPVIADDGVLSQTELDSLVAAAIARWEAAGISAEQLAVLRGVTFSVEDLPGWYLGQASAGHVTLDKDAAGNSWFVDSTPLSDEEFANNGGQLSATANGGAAGRLDALTTIVHELGHQLGLNDSYADADANNVMYGYLHLSERRLAAAHQADGAVPHLAAGGMDFLFSPASLGNATLGANKTLTIVFDATIATFANQLVPASVSTQVQLAYNDGTAKTANSTAAVTTLDSLAIGNLIFNDANRNGIFDAGDSGVNGVALSLFVDANNDNTPDTPATPLLTTTTAGGGIYSFTGLAPGNYIVRVDQSNFNTGGVLLTLPLASPFGGDPDISDPDTDNDSNGTIVSGNGALSQAITLAYNTEPTAGTGNDTNNTLDFGFMSLLADLQITKTDGVTTAVPGSGVTYTITVSNAGPNDVTGATVADTFAGILSGVTWTSVAAGGASGNTASSNGNINETVSLPSGGSITYTVTGNISPTATGTLANTATVTAPAAVTDPNSANNSATDTDTLTPQGDLVITKTDGVTSVVPGNTVTYTITATNNGPSTATGATVADTFPASLTGVSWSAVFAGGATGTASGSGNLSQLVTLPSGGTATYTVTGTVASTATGTLSNTATITAPGGFTDPTPGNNSATDSDTLTPQADLSITKTDGVTTKVPGTSNTYTIVVTNSGPSFVTGATVADLFPGIFNGASWMAVFAGSGSSGTTSGNGNLNETINLASGGTATYTVTGTVASSATGTLSNTATVTAPGGTTDTNTGNNSATDTDTLTPQADLSITKTDGVTTAVPGGSVTYTITASNSGPSNAVGATVADTFPAFLSNVTWTAVGAGGGTATASGSGNINDTVNLPAGGSVTYTVTGTVNPSATGTLSNTATVAAPGGVTDPTPGNNSATDTDTLTPQADLSITKTDGVTTAVPGGSVTYTITASNSGLSNVIGATVADTFPAFLSNVTWTAVGAGGGTATASGSGNINDTVNLPAGGSVTYTVTGTVNPSATGTLSNTATVAAPGGVTDPTPGNNSATDTDTLTPQADLSITKTDGKTEVQPGTNTYTIVVSNSGPSNVVGALIQDTFPVNFTNVTWTAVGAGGVTGYSLSGSGNINDSEGSIPSGGSITYTVTGTVPLGATGTLSNTATVSAPGGVTDPTPGNNSATDTTQIVSDDLSITKTDNSESAVPGSTVTYTIVVRNSQYSLVAANGATVGDVFPASLSNLTLVSVVGTNGAVSPLTAGPIGNNFTDTVNLPIDSTLTYTISGLVNSAVTGTLSNTATITAPGGFNDTQSANNSATDTDILTPQFDFGITKTDSPDPVIAGQNVIYTIDFTKSGPSNAGNVVVSDILPAGLTFVSASFPAGWSPFSPVFGGTGTVSFSKSSVATGESGTFVIVAKVDPSVTQGTVISNTASASSTGTDTNSANDSATATTTVNAAADLAVTITDSPDPVFAGTDLTYTITVTNSGPSDAQNVALSDPYPGAFVSWMQTSGPAFNVPTPGLGQAAGATIATLAAGATATFELKVHIASNTPDGAQIGNTSTISSDTTDATPGNNSATAQTLVGLQSDLSITKTDGITIATPGTQVTYTITASNSGPSDVIGATVSDTFLAILNGVTWTAVGAGGGTVAASGSGNINELVNLPSGGSVTFTVTGTIDSSATGILFNTATVAAPANVQDPTPGNNSATDTDTLQPQADLVVTKSGTEGAVAGTGVNYTITVTNSGPSDAQTVSLNDILPAGMTFVSLNAPDGWSATTPAVGANGTISASTATLAAGASATFTFAGHVNSNVVSGTILSNTATASTATLDPSEGNNASTATTFISTQADLAVTKSAPTAVAPSGDITYTIHLDNNGPSDAQSVNLSDVLPAGTSLVSVTTPSGWTRVDGTEVGANGTIVFVKGAVASGETGADFTIVVNSGSIAAGTSISNSAVATTGTTDNNPANNTGTAPTLIGGVNLSVSKSDGIVTTTPGSTLTYTIDYANAGYQNATGVVLTETLPAGTTFNAAASTAGWTQVGSTNQYTLNIGTIAGTNAGEGGTGTAVFVVGVVSSAPTGLDQIANSVSIAYDGSQGPDTDLSDNTSTDTDTLDAAPDLTITKTNPLVSVPRGYTLGYTLNYSNAGNQNATGVVLRETLPAGTTFNPGASSEGWTLAEDSSGDYILVLGNVDAGSSGTKTFAVTVNSSGPDTINNTASIADDGTNGADQDSEDNSASLSKAVYKGIYAVAPGIPLPKRGSPANVRVFDIATGTELPSITAYETPYRDSVRLAIADMNGDGFDDIITAKRTSTGSIRVFDGLTGERFDGALSQINAFNGRTEKGAFVAAGDVNGDGQVDIIAGSALGGRGLVKVFDGRDGSLLAQTRPFGSSFIGGIRVAAGDLDGDGRDEIVTAKGYLGGTVKVYDLVGGGKGGPTSLVESFRFLVGGSRYRGGVSVAVADLDGDGKDDIVTGRNTGRTLIETFSGIDGHSIAPAITPFGAAYRNGVRVATADVNGDGIADIIAGSGLKNHTQVKFFDGDTQAELTDFAFQAYPQYPTVSLFVAGSPVHDPLLQRD